ncbi:MAG: MmcQ/YjbR family DNA-binding protein [Bacteroides sp.]|nr:MmcQ/YjbR family DNA-binding protein [Eubacterium sp.]MCM1418765.1 MmcQ/YjbR family DNA-binding protein [Roseburia sp.]MCM1462010.1 MmcQ/YjbR family DNA-binding protein [Bacteroides sp.]
MDRKALEKHIAEEYHTDAEYPWLRYPDYAVFRHAGNRKWFAAILVVPREKLGLKGEGKIDIVNVKCDPILVGRLVEEDGVYPAYHMNKENWVSVALDGSAEERTVCSLLQRSFELTFPRGRGRRGSGQ